MPKRKRKKLTKDRSQRYHAKWAIHNRYGIFCNRWLYQDIVNAIQTHDWQHEFILRQSCSRTLHKVHIPVDKLDDERTNLKVPVDADCVKVYVVYDNERGELCTVLPWYATDEELLKDYYANHEYVRS